MLPRQAAADLLVRCTQRDGRRMLIRLNKIQRGIVIGTAIIIAIIQSAGILDHGLEENRGWVWAFLVSAVLLVVGFAKPENQALVQAHSASQTNPSSPATRPVTAVDKEQFTALMARALAVVNESSVMASRLHTFVLTKGLYHKSSTLAFVLDPYVHSALAAHAFVVIALAEAKTEPDRLVWETYRTTLANRLAEKRAAVTKEIAQASSSAGMQKLAALDTKPEFLVLVKGEMDIWEKVARCSLDEDEEVKYGSLPRHVSATFGGRRNQSDDDQFVPVLSELLDYARGKVVPVLAKST